MHRAKIVTFWTIHLQFQSFPWVFGAPISDIVFVHRPRHLKDTLIRMYYSVQHLGVSRYSWDTILIELDFSYVIRVLFLVLCRYGRLTVL